jgi:methylthioribulose-1-phosphate dehydratase
MNVHPAIAEIISAGRVLGERGLLPASSGNLSIRVGDGSVAITRTGTEKAELTPGDVAIIDLHQSPPPGTSAETGLHLAQYRADPQVGAIMHVHSLASTVLSDHFAGQSRIVFSGYELQKAIRGMKTHEIDVTLPIFANSQDIPALAETVLAGLSGRSEIFGYLLAGHGLYAWGKDAAEALRHVVAFEFLLNCELEKLRIRAAGRNVR